MLGVTPGDVSSAAGAYKLIRQSWELCEVTRRTVGQGCCCSTALALPASQQRGQPMMRAGFGVWRHPHQ